MVRMYHDDPSKTGGPTTADVPEDAVSWMSQAGWYQKKAKAEPVKEAESEPAEQAEEHEAPKKGRARK